MNTRILHLPALMLAVFGTGVDAALAREPSMIVEDIRESTPVIAEVTVNGAHEAAAYRAHKARFEAEMAAFARTVHTRYRETAKARLTQSICGTSLGTPGTRG